VSNPVAPPPSPEGMYPPPANQGFGAAPAPGHPQPGQPGYPAPGQPQQGFGDAPVAPPAAPSKKSGFRRILLRIGAAVLLGIVVVVAKGLFFSATDEAKDAAIGDCIASSKKVSGTEETDASAKVVDCASADAAFTVIGRVNGETDTNSKSCDKYFKENEEFFVYAADNGTSGYLLCLKPKP
jgi:hypothetical protein